MHGFCFQVKVLFLKLKTVSLAFNSRVSYRLQDNNLLAETSSSVCQLKPASNWLPPSNSLAHVRLTIASPVLFKTVHSLRVHRALQFSKPACLIIPTLPVSMRTRDLFFLLLTVPFRDDMILSSFIIL